MACHAPRWARPFAAPPLNTRPTPWPTTSRAQRSMVASSPVRRWWVRAGASARIHGEASHPTSTPAAFTITSSTLVRSSARRSPRSPRSAAELRHGSATTTSTASACRRQRSNHSSRPATSPARRRTRSLSASRVSRTVRISLSVRPSVTSPPTTTADVTRASSAFTIRSSPAPPPTVTMATVVGTDRAGPSSPSPISRLTTRRLRARPKRGLESNSWSNAA